MKVLSPTSWIQALANRFGYQIVKVLNTGDVPFDMNPEFKSIYERSRDYTQTYVANLYSLYTAINYVVKNDIPGDVVELGVWKGGSMMAAALSLMGAGDASKNIWLYDTFTGMSEPSREDIQTFDGMDAFGKWKKNEHGTINQWNYSPLEIVKQNMLSTDFPSDRLSFVKGPVEETIPDTLPENISILRLDMDWYNPTYHALVHLFPKLANKGVLIIDDYGWWQGCKKACDTYFEESRNIMMLNRIDVGARVMVKSS